MNLSDLRSLGIRWGSPLAAYSTDGQLLGLECIVNSFGYGVNMSWSLWLAMDRDAWLLCVSTCREKLASDLKACARSNAVVCAVTNLPLISVHCRAIRSVSWMPASHSSTRYTPLSSFLLPVASPPLARLCSKHSVNVPLPTPMPSSASVSLVEQAAVMPLTVPVWPRFTTLWPLKDTAAPAKVLGTSRSGSTPESTPLVSRASSGQLFLISPITLMRLYTRFLGLDRNRRVRHCWQLATSGVLYWKPRGGHLSSIASHSEVVNVTMENIGDSSCSFLSHSSHTPHGAMGLSSSLGSTTAMARKSLRRTVSELEMHADIAARSAQLDPEGREISEFMPL
mmetsp:Transcript_4047/g.10369  ORF Transcript_4047/g.10369 Transcript_4047/m.10369 type:complete len:339 (+) Transcript_4047:5533-6549(+)